MASHRPAHLSGPGPGPGPRHSSQPPPTGPTPWTGGGHTSGMNQQVPVTLGPQLGPVCSNRAHFAPLVPQAASPGPAQARPCAHSPRATRPTPFIRRKQSLKYVIWSQPHTGSRSPAQKTGMRLQRPNGSLQPLSQNSPLSHSAVFPQGLPVTEASPPSSPEKSASSTS